MVQGEGSAVRAGEMLLLIPALLNPRTGALLAPCVGEACRGLLSPFPLGPGAGGGWKRELQPRARRDVCPRGRDPRHCRNPGSLFPGAVGLCSWPDWLQQLLPLLSCSNPVTISSVTACSVQPGPWSCSVTQGWDSGGSAAGPVLATSEPRPLGCFYCCCG